MVELLCFQIAFNMLQGEGAWCYIFSYFLFFIILVPEMLVLKFVSWAIILISPSMHALFFQILQRLLYKLDFCTIHTWTSIFRSLQCNGKQAPPYFFLFLSYFSYFCIAFGFFDRPMSKPCNFPTDMRIFLIFF